MKYFSFLMMFHDIIGIKEDVMAISNAKMNLNWFKILYKNTFRELKFTIVNYSIL